MSALPQAVAEHLRVLGIPAGPISIHAYYRGGQWVRLTGVPDFTERRAQMLQGLGALRLELRMPSGFVSEFEIEELV